VHETWNDADWRGEPARAGLVGSWASLARGVRAMAMDVTVAGFQLARQMPTPPPLGPLLSAWSRVEAALPRELKTRLDRLDVEESGVGSPPGRSRRIGELTRRSPAQLLDDLLGASASADGAESRTELYRSLLLRLVPDEARILVTLSDGTAYPLLHVLVRANGGRVVLANASTVGRDAEVRLPEATSTYVSHLRSMGLAEECPADDALDASYDELLADPTVRAAEQEARTVSRLGARLVRRTLRLSALGGELWRACRPAEVPVGSANGADRRPDAGPVRISPAAAAGRWRG